MQKIAKFEKVSFEQYRKDFIDTFEPNYDNLSQSGKQYVDNVITEFYNNIQLPTRSTKGSAGYDFKSPSHLISLSAQIKKFLLVLNVKFKKVGF